MHNWKHPGVNWCDYGAESVSKLCVDGLIECVCSVFSQAGSLTVDMSWSFLSF